MNINLSSRVLCSHNWNPFQDSSLALFTSLVSGTGIYTEGFVNAPEDVDGNISKDIIYD